MYDAENVEFKIFSTEKTPQLLIIEHQPANYKLCFLSEAKLFGFIVDLKNYPCFIYYASCQTPGKNETKRRNNNVLFPGFQQFF